jgi:hypothetical protein
VSLGQATLTGSIERLEKRNLISYSETITEEHARQIGISSFLMKPVSLTDFAVAVRRTLDKAKKS